MIDACSLRPSEALRVLNSTPLGETVGDRSLRSHMNRAGMRIGDGRTLDLVRYAAWLVDERHGRRRATSPAGGADGYERYRERKAREASEMSRSGRDIGPIPPVADQARRDSTSRDFRRFCETYLSRVFTLDWSDDHLKVIARIETAVLLGGLFAMAMARGSGKSSLCEAACTWAILFGHRRFVALIGSAEPHAESMLQSIRIELETNELLLADFPEVCHPVARLEGIAQRAVGQLCDGGRTHIHWGSKTLVLPTVAGSAASGAIVRVAGLTGQIRGMVHTRPDGRKARPDLVVVDDPQTDESARSPVQCQERESLLSGAVLGLGGPGTEMSGFMPCTVIRPDDLADRILDRTRHPEWQGERMSLVYAWPSDQALWDRYRELRRESLRNGGRGETATELYRSNRAAMDAGARVAWPARHKRDELSAIQHAWNLRIDLGDRAFFSEYQNDPLPTEEAGESLTVADITKRVNRIRRGEVPTEATALTAFVDVQGKLLYWLAVAWEQDCTGYVVDYGTHPDQKLAYFTLREAKRTLAQASPGAGAEAALRAGLEKLCERLLDREFVRSDGGTMRVTRCLVDANYETEIVKGFCRRSRWANVLTPAHGRFVGATSVPFADYVRKRGDRIGVRWRIPALSGRSGVRHVLFDSNWWKGFVHRRLSTAVGDPGSMTLFGASEETHVMFAEQVTAERCVPVEARGRTVDQWELRQPGLDNHLLDCLAGAAVAASMESVAVTGIEAGDSVRDERPIRLSAIRRRA